MSVTKNQMIFDIKNIASSGTLPVPFKIEEEQISFWIDEVRSMLISQAIQKKSDISDVWLQTINCFEMEKVDISECCKLDFECYGVRSVKKLPADIETDDANTILAVTAVDGTSFTKSNLFRYKYKKYSKFTSKQKGWFIKDDYLYLINDLTTKYVTVRGLFEEPEELTNYVNCDGVSCYTRDSVYPVGLKMAGQITDIVVKTKVAPFMQFPNDRSNDAQNIPEVNKQ